MSLRREDAAKLGYDNAKAWRDLLRGQANKLAKAMGIPLGDLRWYAAFHNEGRHPHIHLISYSVGKEPYMTEQALQTFKSDFAREIFKNDLYHTYQDMTAHRNELRRTGRDKIAEIVQQINNSAYENETVVTMLRELSKTLENYKGKTVYGYMPKAAKNLINGVIDELAKDARIAELYNLWYEQKENVFRTYQDTMPKRIPLSANKEFNSIKNAVIQEALNILHNRITFEEDMRQETETPEETMTYTSETTSKGNPWTDPNDMHFQYIMGRELLDIDSENFDPEEGVRLLTLSAMQGFDVAMYRLGKLYLQGEVVEKNVGEALQWFWKADAKDNPYAQYQLGKIYLSTLKAFDIPADDVMKIVDVYNAIGNTEATSSAGIGEALQRSASALSVAGASVEEASALAAAMNTTVQNSEKVGTTLKTASMYLRAAKTDAEDAGESTEGMAESVSQLRDELKSITGVDIMKDDDTFKGIFQQYRELAAVWNSGKLTDVAKANVLNLLGGKRNADAISGMLNNWEVAERALQTAQNSSGSALSENEKYLDSINGKISRLKAQFEDISRQILSSDTVKWTADLLQNVLKIVDGLAETKTLLPTIFALIATNKGLGVAGTDSLGNITVFGKTKEQRATNKYLGSVVDENTFLGFKSPVLNLTSDELKTLKAFNAEIISGTAGQEAFEKHLSKSRDYVKNLGQELEVGAVSMQTIETATKQTALTTVNSNITAKQQAISAQENIVATKKANIQTTYETPLQNYAKECSLELTAVDINGSQIFTQELLNELSAYINPAEYSDEYITQTDDMKYAEIYQQSNKLFDRAKKELEKLSTQSYTFSVENNSFLFNKKFERFSKQLMPGAIVYLETSDDHMEQVHLTNFSIDYDDCSVSFTFGNKYDENDIKSLFDDVFGSVKTSAAAVKYLKNIVNDQRSELDKQRDWIDNALTLTKNHFLTSNNQSVIIDDSGYWGRRQSTDADGNLIFDTAGNPIYDNEQLKLTNNGMYLTTDNWDSLATAVGKIYLYHDEETDTDVFKYGVSGEVVVGKMFLGKTLTLLGSMRDDGTYAITLNENGLTIINDGTTAGITIKDANGNKQFYADSDGNLCVSANITATSGSIGGWKIADGRIYNKNSATGYTFSLWNPGVAGGMIICCDKDGVASFSVSRDGYLHASNANITGTINAGSVLVNGVKVGTGQNTSFEDFSSNGTIWKNVHNVNGGRIYLTSQNLTGMATNITFDASNAGSLGAGTWYYNGGTILSSSDRRFKNSISSFPESFHNFYQSLTPRVFKYNNGSSNRYHTGFIAQEVEEAILKNGLTLNDLALFVRVSHEKAPTDDINGACYLRYEEFISLNTWEIQKLLKKIQELERRINLLEN